MTPSPVRGAHRLGEAARLEALRLTGLLSARDVPSLDRLTGLATRLTGAPVALVSLVERRRQVFASAVGLPEPWATVCETPLSHSFCQHVVADDAPLVVEDARTDARLQGNLAVSEMGVLAYAGFPLRTPDGHVLGSFCVIDTRPRAWGPEDLAVVDDLAAAAAMEVALRLRSAEHALEAARVRALLDAATGTSIIGCDLAGTVTEFNPGAERLLGHDAADVVGVGNIVDFHDRAEIRRRAAEVGVDDGLPALIAGVHEAAPHQTRDWTYVALDGQRLTVSVTMSAVVDSVGDVSGYLAVAEDVTVRRQTERALQEALATQQEASRRLRDVDHVRSEFVATASHELRTPIASILGYSELLLDGSAGELSEHQARLLQRVDRSGRRLLQLVEDYLSMARIEAGTFELHPERLDLRDVVARAFEGVRPLLVGRDLELHLDLPPGPAAMRGDAAQLERVAVNLLSNAVKFTPDGGRVAIQVRHGRNQTELQVADTGVGVPASEQHQLFNRFFRSSTAQRMASQGAGLGLSIVRAVVEGHGGQVTVDTQEGVGTTVSVSLPNEQAHGEYRGQSVAAR